MLYILTAVSIALGLLTGGTGNGKHGVVGGQPVGQNESSARCPLIYAPVICDNGKTYPNQCVADQHHAKNCVPAGGLAR